MRYRILIVVIGAGVFLGLLLAGSRYSAEREAERAALRRAAKLRAEVDRANADAAERVFRAQGLAPGR